MVDCEAVINSVETTGFDETSISFLVNSYNQCVGYSTLRQFTYISPTPIKKVLIRPLFNLSFGPELGLSFNSIKYLESKDATHKYLETLSMERNVSPLVGVFARLGYNGSKWMEIQLSFKYNQQTFTGTNVLTQNSGNITYHYAALQFHAIQVPLALKINPFFNGKFSTAIGVGLNNTILFNSFNHSTTEQEIGNIVYISESKVFPVKSYQSGIIAGLELRYKIGESKAIGLELSYQANGKLDNVPDENLAKSNAFCITASLQFIGRKKEVNEEDN